MAEKKLLAKIFLNPKFLAFFGLVIIILISFPIAKNISQRYKIDKEIKELEKEIISIESKNIDLRKLIDYLGSDQYAEEQARLNFGLKKPGEETAVVNIGGNSINKENSQAEESEDNNKLIKSIYNISGIDKAQPKKPINNPERWRSYFFGENN